MALQIRSGNSDDVVASGRILYEAFTHIAEAHSFPSDFPSIEFGEQIAGYLLGNPGFASFVAEDGGQQLGINFLDERGVITGVGPIGIDPTIQNSGVGRQLMDAVINRSEQIDARGIRLLQDVFHNRSFALYTKLGFTARTTAAVMQGPPIANDIGDRSVRPATMDDLGVCGALCKLTHGHDRNGELRDAIESGGASVVEETSGIAGYTTGIGLVGHAVVRSNEDLKALIAAAPEFTGPGFLLPTGNAELLNWCMGEGLRVEKMMTIITSGFYQNPTTPYLPSVLY